MRSLKVPSEKKISSGASFSFISRLVSAGLGYVNLVLIANVLTLQEFGHYNFLISLLTIAYIIANVGVENTLIYLMPFRKKQGTTEYRNLLITSQIFILCSSTIIFLILFFTRGIFSDVLDDSSIKSLILIVSLTIPIQAFVVFFRVYNQASYNYILSTVPENIIRPIIYFTFLLILIIYKIENINMVLIFYICSYIAALGFGAYYFLKENTFIYKQSFNKRFSFDYSIVTQSTNFLIIQLLNQLAPFIVIMVMGIVISSSDIGIFRAAFQTAALIAFALRAFEIVYTPIISSLYSDGKFEELNDMYKVMTNWVLGIGGIICIIAFHLSKSIMGIFGDEFQESAIIFQILAINQLINSSFGSVEYMLMMTGKSKVVRLVSVIQVVIVVISSWYLINMYGLIGAAISITLGTLFFKLILFIIMKKIHGFTLVSKRFILIWVLLILNFILLYLIKSFYYIQLSSEFFSVLFNGLIYSLIVGCFFFIPFYIWGLNQLEREKIKRLVRK